MKFCVGWRESHPENAAASCLILVPSISCAASLTYRARLGLLDLGGRCLAGGLGGEVKALDPEAVRVAAGRRYIASLRSDAIPLGYLQVSVGQVWIGICVDGDHICISQDE